MPMVYFMSGAGNIIGLDCEEKISVKRRNAVTESSVMSKKKASDGYSVGNKELSISGKVTYNKTARNEGEEYPDPYQMQELLDEIIEDHQKFTVYTDTVARPLLKGIENCVIADYSVDLGGWKDTIQLSLSLKEVFVTNPATITEIAATETQKDGGSKTEKGKSSKTQTPKEDSNTMLRNLFKNGRFSDPVPEEGEE